MKSALDEKLDRMDRMRGVMTPNEERIMQIIDYLDIIHISFNTLVKRVDDLEDRHHCYSCEVQE